MRLVRPPDTRSRALIPGENTMTGTSNTNSPKRIFVRAFGFGAGFAIVAGLIVAAIAWYIEIYKPSRPWNKTAITATYSHVHTEGDDETLVLFYTLKNNTNAYYEVSKSSDLQGFLRIEEDKDAPLVPFKEIHFWADEPFFLPARESLQYRIHLPDSMKSKIKQPATHGDKELKEYRKELEAHLEKAFLGTDGFIIFDKEYRYQIEFPKPWSKEKEEQSE